jgi:hypothetical protein
MLYIYYPRKNNHNKLVLYNIIKQQHITIHIKYNYIRSKTVSIHIVCTRCIYPWCINIPFLGNVIHVYMLFTKKKNNISMIYMLYFFILSKVIIIHIHYNTFIPTHNHTHEYRIN